MASGNISIPVKAYIEGKVFIQVGDAEPAEIAEVTIPIQLGATTAELEGIIVNATPKQTKRKVAP